MGAYSKEIHGLMKAIDAIRGDEIDMPTQQVQAFLAVALRPGLTMADLADTVGMSQSSCSRNIAALSKWHRLGDPGLDLVEAIEDPHERRRKIMFLTPKGRRRVMHVLEVLTGGVVDYDSPSAEEGLPSAPKPACASPPVSAAVTSMTRPSPSGFSAAA